jgi:hypothetical protein
MDMASFRAMYAGKRNNVAATVYVRMKEVGMGKNTDGIRPQTLLKADSQKVRGKISRKETPVRRGIDAYFLAVVIKILRRESAGTVFTHERLHQLVIPRPQAAIQHLIQGSIRLVETDKHFIHLPAQSMRQ